MRLIRKCQLGNKSILLHPYEEDGEISYVSPSQDGIDVNQIIDDYQMKKQEEPRNWADYTAQGFGYVMNPLTALSDYVQSTEWAPDWLKTSAPYIAAMAPVGGSKKPAGYPRQTRYKGTQATTSNSASKRGAYSPSRQKSVDYWNNLETTGNVRGEMEAGGMYIDSEGFRQFRGQIGRPWGSRKPKVTAKEQQPAASYASSSKKSSDISRGRGRPSKESIEELYKAFETTTPTVVPRSTLSGNSLRTFMNRMKAWKQWVPLKEAQLIERAKNRDFQAQRELHLLRQRMQGIDKKLRNNGYNLDDFK